MTTSEQNRERKRRYREAYPDKWKAQRKAERLRWIERKRANGIPTHEWKDPEGIRGKLQQYRKFDRSKGLSFDLTTSWYREHILGKPCIYCGAPSCGCDRKDNKTGHTQSNCVPCCRNCNIIRNDIFTVDEMMELGPIARGILDRRSTLLSAGPSG